MKPFSLAIAPLVLVSCLASCVSGPDYASIADRIPPIAEHCGRIYCMRSVIESNLLQPEFLLNGAAIGTSKAGGFFYVDRPAGDYVVSLSHPSSSKLALHLEEGKTCYVDSLVMSASLEKLMTVMLVRPEDGERVLSELKYTGPELPAPKAKP